MHLGPPIRVDATKILTRRELSLVLTDLHEKARRSAKAPEPDSRSPRLLLRLTGERDLRTAGG